MCGIAGFVAFENINNSVLKDMCDLLIHRGPDDFGYFFDENVGLGARRLAIIDVTSGHQPIGNEDGSIWVTFNGEIYNFKELTQELEEKGHIFKTKTDTETLVHLYEEYGINCLDHLRGMFAFGIWDKNKKRLIIAKDRLGKKPLYFTLNDQGFWFASELKALTKTPGFKKDINYRSLNTYLSQMYVPAPESIFLNIQKLPPAHYLIFDESKRKITSERYWQLDYEPKLNLDKKSALEQFKELLIEATRIRMISERPLGAFLSGGIDSSLVVAAMSKISDAPINTFSIGFEDSQYDERHYARMVAERYSTIHTELVVKPDILELLPELAWYYDEPYADSSSIPTYYLAKMARQHVVVALNGDGGDENFAGYTRYKTTKLFNSISIPGLLRPKLSSLGEHITKRNLGSRNLQLIAKLFRALSEDPSRRYARIMDCMTPAFKQELYSPETINILGSDLNREFISEAMSKCESKALVDKLLCTDVNTYLPYDLLVKVDIATMANSLEARSPLLDHKLMQFVASLPDNLKIKGLNGKYLLKELAKSWLPKAAWDRPKKGFGIPLNSWLKHDLKEMVQDLLTDQRARQRGYFDPVKINKLLQEFDQGIDHGSKIWVLLQLELWHRCYESV
jgi:asparagine synthase (glutamine-hydrolysing)